VRAEINAPEIDVDRLKVRVEREFYLVMVREKTQPVDGPRKRAVKHSIASANAAAITCQKKDNDFVHGAKRQWAESIGCSVGLVAKLPLWKQTMNASGRGRATCRPNVGSFSGAAEDGLGRLDPSLEKAKLENEMVLAKLTSESASDSRQDPSPLDKKTARPRQHKQL